MDWIDLRSDTVTRPTEAMRRAMAEAVVGDDVLRDDPTVMELESLAAQRLGKEAALFVPSGTMANLASVLTHCGRGDEMIVGDAAHLFLLEAGGSAALGGVQPRSVPTREDGSLDPGKIEAAIRTPDVHHPVTRLICLENTHNRAGGAPLSAAYTDQVGAIARRHGLRLHLDGARIFNAAVALGTPADRLAQAADSVTFCLSKGLCAPVGSLICGSGDFIERARRTRKQLGGGMRQAGVIAAAGIVALETMVERLADDHARAARLASGLAKIPWIRVEKDPPPTNMIFFDLTDSSGMDSKGLETQLKAKGVLIHPVGSRRVRLVLHHDVDDEGVEDALAAFSGLDVRDASLQ
jgi:threonine aldolase